MLHVYKYASIWINFTDNYKRTIHPKYKNLNIRKRYFCSCNEIITNVKIFKIRKKKTCIWKVRRNLQNSSNYLKIFVSIKFILYWIRLFVMAGLIYRVISWRLWSASSPLQKRSEVGIVDSKRIDNVSRLPATLD